MKEKHASERLRAYWERDAKILERQRLRRHLPGLVDLGVLRPCFPVVGLRSATAAKSTGPDFSYYSAKSIPDKEDHMPQTNELKRYRCFEIFSQSTGLEIREAFKAHEENGLVTERSGRIQLRFFKLTPRTKPDEITQIRFICEPDEAFGLSLMIAQVAGSSAPCREKLSPHKFLAGEQGGEIMTTLSVEKWERSGKNGYALTVGRGKDFISVPAPLAKFLFAGEFLRFLSTVQCWVERPEKRNATGKNE